MKKELIISKKSADINAVIEYFLITELYNNNDDAAKVYGVQVDLIQNGKRKSSETVRDISCRYAAIQKFIFLLAENDVMPSTLFDIVSDKIEEGYFEAEKQIA